MKRIHLVHMDGHQNLQNDTERNSLRKHSDIQVKFSLSNHNQNITFISSENHSKDWGREKKKENSYSLLYLLRPPNPNMLLPIIFIQLCHETKLK